MTRLFGVLGHPIDHSLSPVMHTAAFQAMGADARYTALDVPPRFLRPILRAVALSGVSGCNLTVPLKEAVVPLLDRLDRSARQVGAVNTVVIRGRRLIGHNTDVAGFRRALIEDLGVRCRGREVLLLGAGGAARAVAWALRPLAPRALLIANRTRTRAARLVASLRRAGFGIPCAALTLSDDAVRPVLARAGLVVNATTLGLRAEDPLPLDPVRLRPETVVVDLIYHRATPLIRAARRRGCRAADGLPMLLYQGVESLRLWGYPDPPVAAMRRALREAVQPSGRVAAILDGAR